MLKTSAPVRRSLGILLLASLVSALAPVYSQGGIPVWLQKQAIQVDGATGYPWPSVDFENMFQPAMTYTWQEPDANHNPRTLEWTFPSYIPLGREQWATNPDPNFSFGRATGVVELREFNPPASYPAHIGWDAMSNNPTTGGAFTQRANYRFTQSPRFSVSGKFKVKFTMSMRNGLFNSQDPESAFEAGSIASVQIDNFSPTLPTNESFSCDRDLEDVEGSIVYESAETYNLGDDVYVTAEMIGTVLPEGGGHAEYWTRGDIEVTFVPTRIEYLHPNGQTIVFD